MADDLRLFLDIEVIEFVRALKPRQQEQFLSRFREIAAFPGAFFDYTETDSVGRDLGVHLFGDWAIQFWEDIADRQLKIVEITLADRAGQN